MISIYMKGRKQKGQSKKGNDNKSKVRAIVIGLKRVEQEMFGGLHNRHSDRCCGHKDEYNTVSVLKFSLWNIFPPNIV